MSQNNDLPEKYGQFIRTLRDALPYLEEFHNETFVIKITGNALLDENHRSILDDLVLLHRVGIKIILVHGAGPQIEQILNSQHVQAEYEDDRMLISESLLPLVQQAIASVNWQLMSKLSAYGDDIVPFSGHMIQAQKKMISKENDFHFTGDVAEINSNMIQFALSQRFLPIIAPFGIGKLGRLWILEPNQIAMEIASRLRARKLIILTTENFRNSALLRDPRETTTDEMREWLKANDNLASNQKLQLRSLITACERGVERCHLLDSTIDGALLGEILTSLGMGTMITNSSYKRMRSAKLSDIPMILDILDKPMKDVTLVHKSSTHIEQHIEAFRVFCIDEEIVGCCEMISYKDSQAIEIASLAVKENQRNRGIGQRLVKTVVDHARQNNLKMVFALTTQSSQFFINNGFKEMPFDQLPHAKRIKYDFADSLIYGVKP